MRCEHHGGRGLGRVTPHRQRHRERGALARSVAGDRHRAAMHLGQAPDDGQPEAEAAVRAGARAVGLPERFEHVRE